MLTWIARKFFGTSNDRTLRRLQPKVAAINALEDRIARLSDVELRAKTAEFKERIDNGASVDSLLIEAFAVCREAGRRALRMRHYDVQLVGGMVLHSGSIAEMKTGEGKTLVATLPVYLNALEGKGVHVVTVNDYLARRDAEWMGKLYNFLGLTVGIIVSQQPDREKRESYQRDICYGQNNEFGFDYLRDNMKFSALDYAQRPLHYAIVDEVDSILIDEARTPLIISGTAEAASEKYRTLNEVVVRLVKDQHYTVDEKGFSATLNDDGVEAVQRMTGVSNLYDPVNVQTLHIANQLLRAHALYKRDQHYMVSPEGKVLIIDEFTGRVLAGRRWSDGLHQAVEAKENVRIQEESRTMATITFQNLFRIYKKLAGMTGTAQTEAAEFMSTYKLDVTTIPTNKPMIREDQEDVVYKTEREKFTAVIREIMEEHERGRPILVGTTSVEKSAAISRILKKKSVSHHVLNAKQHENEAYVVAQAGKKGAITVSTNMAGRGTDIMLGGNPEMLARLAFRESGRDADLEPEAYLGMVKQFEEDCLREHDEVIELGGLHILGTERHESRRIDNQLRGRAGRQGDPGSSRFYLSLEDDLMRIFAGDRVKNLMDRMGMPDDEPIEHPWVTKSVENAQRKVEERNFDIRKNLLEYDDVMNAQRKTVYALRQSLLAGRYEPEELDELGKPTGRLRQVEVKPEIVSEVAPLVSRLIGLYAEEPVQPVGKNGKPRALTDSELDKIDKLVQLPDLQREVYHLWGVVIDVNPRLRRTPRELYEELLDLVGRGLSEQRERLLDLIDRVVVAMVEESCPANKLPEDWDWKSIHQGFNEHFRVKLDHSIDELGDVERLVRILYDTAESVYLQKEKALGIENMLRLLRHIYLEAIDEAWVDHLSNMEHLRDGIGLRGYGQRDPKNEYKKEGYNLFLNMMAKVSSNVLVRLVEAQARSQAEIEALEQRDQQQRQTELAQAVARHPGESPSIPPEDASVDDALNQLREQAAALAQPVKRTQPKIGRNDACPCGSGKKFKQCHGRVDDDEAAEA